MPGLHNYEGMQIVPHDRTQTQTAGVIGSADSFAIPPKARFARFFPLTTVNFVVEMPTREAAAATPAAGSPQFSGSGLEVMIPVDYKPFALFMKVAGVGGTASFQLSWVY